MTEPQHPMVAATGGGPRPPIDQPSFTCPKCGRTSYHPTDIREGYCGYCHDWTGQAMRPAAGKVVFPSEMELTVVKPLTIYVTLHGVDNEGYTQVIGARTTLERAQELALEHAKGQADMLGAWLPLGSGTQLCRVWSTNEYYEVLAVTVTA